MSNDFHKHCNEYWWLPEYQNQLLVKTHFGLVTPYGDNDLGPHWLKCNGEQCGLGQPGVKPRRMGNAMGDVLSTQWPKQPTLCVTIGEPGSRKRWFDPWRWNLYRVSGATYLVKFVSLGVVAMGEATIIEGGPHEKINGHRELMVTMVVTAPGSNDHGSVKAWRGHSSVTARSQLSHSEVTA